MECNEATGWPSPTSSPPRTGRPNPPGPPRTVPCPHVLASEANSPDCRSRIVERARHQLGLRTVSERVSKR